MQIKEDAKVSSQVKLLKATRANKEIIRVHYLHIKTNFEFLITWKKNSENPSNKPTYDLILFCVADEGHLAHRVEEAISYAGSDKNPEKELYEDILNKFNSFDCQNLP